jgi:hypothetical protein
MGSALGAEAIKPSRRVAYECIASRYRSIGERSLSGLAEQFRLIFSMYDRYLSGLPSRNFAIDHMTGEITGL